VGVNKFQALERVSPPVFRVSKEIEQAQVGRVRAVRERRDAAAVEARRAQAARFSWDTCAAQHEAAYRELD
jgi:methylmalonyl-CoA mutase N-terminal domain/subunit